MAWTKKENQTKPAKRHLGCAHCFKGWVKHHKVELVTGRKYDAAAPCAYCFDSHSSPMMILRDGKLYWASRLVDNSELRDLNNLEECPSNFVPGWRNDERYERCAK